MKIVQLLACNNCGRVAVSTEKHKIAEGSMDRECIQGKFEAIVPAEPKTLPAQEGKA